MSAAPHCVAVLPALGSIFFVNVEQRRLAAAQAQDNALRLSRLAAAEQAQLVQGAHQLLAALAQLPVVRNQEPSGCSTLFASLLKHYPAYGNLGVIRPMESYSAVGCPSPNHSTPPPMRGFRYRHYQRIHCW